jgi:hypothetical protein
MGSEQTVESEGIARHTSTLGPPGTPQLQPRFLPTGSPS